MKKSHKIIPLLAVVGIALSACTSSANENIGFDTVPELGDFIHFSGSSMPDGWQSSMAGGTGINENVDAENPDPSIKGNCIFTRSVQYLPRGYEPRGDEYNTKEFVNDMKSSFKNSDSEVKSVSVKTEDGFLEMLSSSLSYDDADSGKTTTRFAVRAMSEVKSSGYKAENPPESPYAQNQAEGVPAIFLKADCTKGEELSDDEWKKLLDSTTVSLNSPLPKPTEEVVPDGSGFTPVPTPFTATQEASPAPSSTPTSNPSEGK